MFIGDSQHQETIVIASIAGSNMLSCVRAHQDISRTRTPVWIILAILDPSEATFSSAWVLNMFSSARAWLHLLRVV